MPNYTTNATVSHPPRGARLAELLPAFRCPECLRGSLSAASEGELACVECEVRYPVVEGVPFLFETASLPAFLRLEERSRAQSDPRRRHAHGGAYHWKEYRIEELLPRPDEAPSVLLVGSGDGGERPFLSKLGFQTTAFDIRRSSGTDFLADAHRLPLESASFDVAISTQVMEHLHSPWLAAAEIARVLRPGGWFIGSVAFLKPYHDSYFHMTHKGVMHLLDSVGLQVDRVLAAQSITYTLYGSMLPVASRPVRRALLGAVDRLLFGARALAWQLTRRVRADEPTDRFHAGIPLTFREFDRLRSAPAVVFRARKR